MTCAVDAPRCGPGWSAKSDELERQGMDRHKALRVALDLVNQTLGR
jgi:hypothetical protein